MNGAWLQLGLVAVLIVANAVFAGSEMALVTLREGQLRRLERLNDRGRRVAALARDPNRFLATIQIGITLAGFLASATAAVALAEPLVPALSWLGAAAGPAAIIVVTLVLTFLTLVFGELAPKRIAMQHPERWSLSVVRPLGALATMCRPAVWLLAKASDLTVRVFGGDPSQHRDDITPSEIRELVRGHRGFTQDQRRIIAGAVEITDRILREVLVPRRAAFTLDVDTPVEAARVRLAESGHSRAPVVRRGNLDDTVGVVALRDLVTANVISAANPAASGPVQLSDAARPPYLLPDTLRVSDALHRFRTDRQQFALVVDEHGAVDGIVTLEDLVEELVGEIYDETDRDVATAITEPDGSLVVPGTFPVHDLPDLGVELEPGLGADFTTIAGLVIAKLGHLPTGPGESVRVDGWTAEVRSVERRAITSVRLRQAARPVSLTADR